MRLGAAGQTAEFPAVLLFSEAVTVRRLRGRWAQNAHDKAILVYGIITLSVA